MLRPGRRGLIFAAGREPLPAFFAAFGAEIVATDQARESAVAQARAPTLRRPLLPLQLRPCSCGPLAAAAASVLARAERSRAWGPPGGRGGRPRSSTRRAWKSCTDMSTYRWPPSSGASASGQWT